MMHTHAIAIELTSAGGLLELLEAQTNIPVSDRGKVTAYRTKLLAENTRKDEDRRILNILQTWVIMRHRITA